MSDATKISIISKQAHATSVYAALAKEGYDPHHLGPNPGSVPPSTQILICRDRSCSSESRHLAIRWAKDTGRPMIMQNGQSGILRELRKLAQIPPRPKAPTPKSFLLDPERLNALLEQAPGKNMSWLASALGTNTNALMPALLDAGRLTEVSATLSMTPPPPEDEILPASAEEIRLWAETVRVERKDDPIEVQLAVLRHLCNGAVDDEALCEALNPINPPMEPQPMVTTTPSFTMPDVSTAPPDGTEWRPAVPLRRLEQFVPEGIELAESWTADDAARIAKAFLARDVKPFKGFKDARGIPKRSYKQFDMLAGKPLAFIAAVLWVIPPETAVTKRSFEAAYREIFKKGMDTRMVSAVAWAMDRPIRNAVTDPPVTRATAVKDAVMKAVDKQPAEVVPVAPAPVPVAPAPVNGVMEALEALRAEVVALRNELAEFKSPRASVTLNDLMAAGATISITPREES
jgi:hypothetical protein